MVQGIRVKKEQAEEVRQHLQAAGLLDTSYRVTREEEYVCLPVKGPVEGFEAVDMSFPERHQTGTLEENLGVLVGEERAYRALVSFDIIGDIAVVDLPDEDLDIKKEVGEALLKTHPSFRTAVLKSGIVEGRMRLRRFEHLAGEEKTETLYKEHGMALKLDLEKAYFSPRLSHERKRILDLTRDGETVVDLFAGIGPFAVLLARNRDVEVHAVELNPDAVAYMEENVMLNKVARRVHVIQGDAREAAPKGIADRVIMNLPKSAHEYLDVAMDCLKEEGGIIHFYTIAPEDDLWTKAQAAIEKAAEDKKRNIKILNKRVIRPYSPRNYHVVLDVRIG